jgi:hypothetical protein
MIKEVSNKLIRYVRLHLRDYTDNWAAILLLTV